MSYLEKSSNMPGSSNSLLWVVLYILLVGLFTTLSLGFVRSAQLTAFYVPLAFLLALRLPRFATKTLLAGPISGTRLIVKFVLAKSSHNHYFRLFKQTSLQFVPGASQGTRISVSRNNFDMFRISVQTSLKN